MSRIVKVFMIAVVVLAVAGVTVTAAPLTITFWHHEAPAHRVAAFQKVIDLFQKANPNIKVKQEVIMWGDAWVKSLSALQANTLPDFEFSIPDLMLTMYKAGALAPVTDIYKEMDAKYKFFPNLKGMYTYKGDTWGVPIFTMVMLMTYRPSLLQQYVGTSDPPDSWEQALQYAKQIS
jgi:ABC-type glycerol-3-phosphate transport system substrate-binding protein